MAGAGSWQETAAVIAAAGCRRPERPGAALRQVLSYRSTLAVIGMTTPCDSAWAPPPGDGGQHRFEDS